MHKPKSLKSLDFQLVQTNSSQKTPATLQSVEYRCQIVNNILKTQLLQTFRSQSSTQYSETLYYFPIEESICLESFEAKYQDKIVKGVVKEKEQAQKEYQENKNQGNFVSYASVQKNPDQDYVHIKLGNLPPNEQVEIVLNFSQQLGSILNKYYIAHIPILYVKDEVSVKLGKNVFTLDLFCTGRISYAESKSTATQKIQVDENTVRFTLSQDNFQLNQSQQIIFSFEGMFDPQVIFGSSKCYHEDKVKSSILPVSNSAMVTFIPNFNEDITNEVNDTIQAALTNGEDITSDEFQQRMSIELVDHLNSSRSEFLFLLDRSGSMSGAAIQRACQALTLFLKSLPNDSYFNVVSFGSGIEKLFPSSLQYTTDNLNKAIDIISKYQADLGGTEIYNPLSNIFGTQRIKGYNKQIFLLTDGEVDRPQEVVGLVKKNNKFNRVHSIGFGSGADQYLIKQSAIAGKGISKIVDFSCDLSEVIIQMLQSCITPTFDDFTITYDHSVFDSTHPQTTDFPCVFKDEIINIHFFFKPLVDISTLTGEQKKISIEYFDSHKQQKVKKEINLAMSDSFTCNSELQESVFKLGKQLYLNENITPQNAKSELIQQAVDFQLLTEKTALICVIESLNDVQKVIFDHSNSGAVYQSSSPINSYQFQQQQQQQQQYQQAVPPPPPPCQMQPNYSTSSLHFAPPTASFSLGGMSQGFSQVPYPPMMMNNMSAPPPPPMMNGIPPPPPPMGSNYYQSGPPLPQSAMQSQFGSMPGQFQQPSYQPTQAFGYQQSYPSSTTTTATTTSTAATTAFIQPSSDPFNQFQNQQLNYDILNQQCSLQPMEMLDDYLDDVNCEAELQNLEMDEDVKECQRKCEEQEDLCFADDIGGDEEEDQEKEEEQTIQSSIPKPELSIPQAPQSLKQNCDSKPMPQKSVQLSQPKPSQVSKSPKLQLDQLLKLVDSQGVWKYDQNLIEQLGGLDANVLQQLANNFSTKDAFMTLFVLAILELFYNQERTKWVLISKKSLNSIKKHANQGVDVNSLKQTLLQQIQN